MRESTIEKKVCDFATSKGWKNYKLNGPGSRGKPDRLFFASGARLLFVEFKAPGKKPTKLQHYHLRTLQGLGFKVHVVDNVEDGQVLFD